MNATNITMTRTAMKAAHALGFTAVDVRSAFYRPKAVYQSKTREGQWRIADRNLCLVGVPDGDTFRVITVIKNGSSAPVKVA